MILLLLVVDGCETAEAARSENLAVVCEDCWNEERCMQHNNDPVRERMERQTTQDFTSISMR